MLSLTLAALLAISPASAPADSLSFGDDAKPQEHVDGTLPSGMLFRVVYDENTISRDRAFDIGRRLASGVWHTDCESKRRKLCSTDPGHYEISIFLYTDPNYPFGCNIDMMPRPGKKNLDGYIWLEEFNCTSKRNFHRKYNEHNMPIMAPKR